jgi:hypothetical protein
MRNRAIGVALAIATATIVAGAGCQPPGATIVYCNSRSDCAAHESCVDGVCRLEPAGTDSGQAADSTVAADGTVATDRSNGDRRPNDAARTDAARTDATHADHSRDARLADSARVPDAADAATPDRSVADAAVPDANPPLRGICGDGTRPCRVVVDEVVFSHTNLYTMPSLALDTNATPHLLFNQNSGGFHGYYAVRVGADNWLVETLPMAVARAGLGIGAGNVPFAVTYGGNNVTSLWHRVSAQWSSIEDLSGQYLGPSGNGVAVDPADDTVYAAPTRSGEVVSAVHRTAWATLDLTAGGAATALALSPQRAPHLAYLATAGTSTWQVFWAAPPTAPEVVLSLQTGGLSRNTIALVVPPRAGSDSDSYHPHVLFALPQSGNAGENDLLVADRSENALWTTHTVAADTPGNDQHCATAPTADGDGCNLDYDEVLPLALAADDLGNVRYLYAWRHAIRSLLGDCTTLPFCIWVTTSDTSTGALRLGWIDSSGVAHDAAIASGVWIDSAVAATDAQDRIHVVALDWGAPPTGTRHVRYWRLEY